MIFLTFVCSAKTSCSTASTATIAAEAHGQINVYLEFDGRAFELIFALVEDYFGVFSGEEHLSQMIVPMTSDPHGRDLSIAHRLEPFPYDRFQI